MKEEDDLGEIASNPKKELQESMSASTESLAAPPAARAWEDQVEGGQRTGESVERGKAYERFLKGDVRHRFLIDMVSLKQ